MAAGVKSVEQPEAELRLSEYGRADAKQELVAQEATIRRLKRENFQLMKDRTEDVKNDLMKTYFGPLLKQKDKIIKKLLLDRTNLHRRFECIALGFQKRRETEEQVSKLQDKALAIAEARAADTNAFQLLLDQERSACDELRAQLADVTKSEIGEKLTQGESGNSSPSNIQNIFLKFR